ncbi:MAG: hypothetical protein HY077_04340 [Elusimicrobia bacterium]|nr:hypothetical protein [Elusimicrobiota bacterium]
MLAASSGEQISGALDREGHGLFTYYLLNGLKGAADPEETGHVTMESLYSYVKTSVEKAARRDNRDQTPQLHAAQRGLRLY